MDLLGRWGRFGRRKGVQTIMQALVGPPESLHRAMGLRRLILSGSNTREVYEILFQIIVT